MAQTADHSVFSLSCLFASASQENLIKALVPFIITCREVHLLINFSSFLVYWLIQMHLGAWACRYQSLLAACNALLSQWGSMHPSNVMKLLLISYSFQALTLDEKTLFISVFRAQSHLPYQELARICAKYTVDEELLAEEDWKNCWIFVVQFLFIKENESLHRSLDILLK